MAEPLHIHPLTVDDYHGMLEAGILTEDDRVELIDGQIVEKMTIGPRHIRAVNVLNEVAVKRASHVVEVSIQNPVRLGRYTEPEPTVIRYAKFSSQRCATRYATGADINTAGTMSFTKLYESIATSRVIEAPSTFRIPISRVRCAAAKDARPNSPAQAMSTARSEKVLTIPASRRSSS